MDDFINMMYRSNSSIPYIDFILLKCSEFNYYDKIKSGFNKKLMLKIIYIAYFFAILGIIG